ncbi:N-acetylmuramoyl-L-alanine amidase-like domain-containing protein [Longibacter sp.]|uniref:N-acetylmuramoyl-L-alanine amidase-like domain-containing protein n=1 Tax=Longibacter sp. TaxID=2045415 RepID=UPI003EBAD48F
MLRPVLLVVLTLSLLVACGSDGNDDASSPGATGTASTPTVSVSRASSFDSLDLPDDALTPPGDTTAARFAAAMAVADSLDLGRRPIGEIMQVLGQTFSGAPYHEGTLDEPATERLVVRFDGFDCVTYVESLLAMARGVAVGDTSYAGFARRLARIRYRAGQSMGYCSRLHYFSDWIRDNDAARFVQDVTPSFASRTFRDSIDFMSTHRPAYRRFATNDSLLTCVQDAETDLAAAAAARPLRYVPQDSIRAVYDQLEAGDVIAIVTSVDGLDIAHTGLAYVPSPGETPEPTAGSVGLLHASLSDGVVVSPDLQRYVQQIGHMIGIVVARPQPVEASSS